MSIYVMVNGLPGNMARCVARHIKSDKRFVLVPMSLTGEEIKLRSVSIGKTRIRLVRPCSREKLDMASIRQEYDPLIVVDFTHPSAVKDNVSFYCDNQLPFVLGTTGGDAAWIIHRVSKSKISAVVSPNMAKPIVAFQMMMEFAAHQFPKLFTNWSLTVNESHQAGKADTSGTARAVVDKFQKMGVNFSVDMIKKFRTPEYQANVLKVPSKYLRGHGWHTYTLCSPDKTVKLEFVHNVNGRDVYALGTLDAVAFLAGKLSRRTKGQVWSMKNVLEG